MDVYDEAELDFYSTMGEYEDMYAGDNSNLYYSDSLIRSDGFTVNTNVFKFLFTSDDSYYGGHVNLEWECVQGEQNVKNSVFE